MKLFHKRKDLIIKLAAFLAIVLLGIYNKYTYDEMKHTNNETEFFAADKETTINSGFADMDTDISTLLTVYNPDSNTAVFEKTPLLQIKYSKKTKKYPKRKGEVGVVNTKYSFEDVRRYGAVGDGVTNDHDALVNALNQNKTVYLQANKIYKCNDGIYMNNGQIIMGNNATILIDNDYAPKSDKIYSFLRYRSGISGTTYSINDLIITFDSAYTRENNTAEFVLFDPYGFKDIELNNVTLRTEAGSSRIHMMYACTGINNLKNVRLINNNQALSGGCLWLKNDISTLTEINCTDSYFYNSCSDETLAIYGTGEVKGHFQNCIFESTNAKLEKNTLPIAIYDSSISNFTGEIKEVDIIFDKCTFNDEFDPTNQYANVCYLGVGSSNFNKNIAVTLNSCIFNDFNPASPFSLRECVNTLANNGFVNNSMINVNNCDLHLHSSVVGTYTAWEKGDSISSAVAASVHIKDSNIDCEYAVIDIPNTQIYPIYATIEDSRINITSAIALVKMVYNTPLLLSLNDNIISTDAVVSEVISDTTESPNRIPLDSIQFISTTYNILNDSLLTDIETYKELN